MISYAHVCVSALRVNTTFAHIQTGLRLMRSLSTILGHFSRNNLILEINHSVNRKSSHSLNSNKFRTPNRNIIRHGFLRIQNYGVKITVDCMQ